MKLISVVKNFFEGIPSQKQNFRARPSQQQQSLNKTQNSIECFFVVVVAPSPSLSLSLFLFLSLPAFCQSFIRFIELYFLNAVLSPIKTRPTCTRTPFPDKAADQQVDVFSRRLKAPLKETNVLFGIPLFSTTMSKLHISSVVSPHVTHESVWDLHTRKSVRTNGSWRCGRCCCSPPLTTISEVGATILLEVGSCLCYDNEHHLRAGSQAIS